MSKNKRLSVRMLMYNPDGKLLLLRRAGNKRCESDSWEFPGGKCENDECAETAILRELREETGIEVDEVDLEGAFESMLHGKRTHHQVFKSSTDIEVAQLSGEHDDFAWIQPVEAATFELTGETKMIMTRFRQLTHED